MPTGPKVSANVFKPISCRIIILAVKGHSPNCNGIIEHEPHGLPSEIIFLY